MRECLWNDGGLYAVSNVDAAIAAGMQDLLDRYATRFMNIAGDLLELGKKLVIKQSDLIEVGFTLAERIGIGPLVCNDSTAGARQDFGAGKLTLGDEPVTRIIVGYATRAVLYAILDFESVPFNRLEQMTELLLARTLRHRKFLPSSGCLAATFVSGTLAGVRSHKNFTYKSNK